METNKFYRSFRNLLANISLELGLESIVNIPDNFEIKNIYRYEKEMNNFLYIENSDGKFYMLNFEDKNLYRTIRPVDLLERVEI